LIQNLQNKISKDWPKIYKDFQSIIRSEKLERVKYRRLMDNSYEEIFKVYTILNLKDEFAKFEIKFQKLSNDIEKVDRLELLREMKLFSKRIAKIPDNRKIISKLNKVSRNLKKKKVNYNNVRKNFDQSFELYRKKLNDIKKVNISIILKLKDYLDVIATSIGVRQQTKIPRELALYLAKCRSSHQDLSLYF